jgi:hypothetical protein
MKKIFVVLVALTLLVTPYAQAKTCSGGVCNYIDTNPSFETSPSHGTSWSYDPGVTFVQEYACTSGSWVASLDNGEAIWRFPYIDAAYSNFKLTFKAYLPGSTNNFYDELKVTVKNNSTQVTETYYVHGNSAPGCTLVNFVLANDYDYTNTTVVFESGGFSTHAWQIDDVSFLAW